MMPDVSPKNTLRKIVTSFFLLSNPVGWLILCLIVIDRWYRKQNH